MPVKAKLELVINTLFVDPYFKELKETEAVKEGITDLRARAAKNHDQQWWKGEQ